MGPTNQALYRLFKADQALRDAEAGLESVERNVRIQDRRVHELNEKSKAAQTALRDLQTKARTLELDLAARDEQIEKYRGQQQNAKNNREYQALLIEINTAKVDRLKSEELLLKTMEATEKAQAEATTLHNQVETEKAKLETMRAQIHEASSKARAIVDSARPDREAAAAAVPAKALAEFNRLSEHHDGDAMAAISKPDRRREEYCCTGCNMELARDVYNKVHSRDDLVICPTCRRLLYIPPELEHADAIGTTPASRKPRTSSTKTTRTKAKAADSTKGDESTAPATAGVEIELRAKGLLGQVLMKAQAESVKSAVNGGANAIEFEVVVNEQLAGIYKGKSADHLDRAIKYFMGEANLAMEVRVTAPAAAEAPTAKADDATPQAEGPADAPAAVPEASTEPTPDHAPAPTT